jgi:ElaB/YqjD/DUF883 family membrane-anchored ribosome-binding protein
MPPKGQKSGAGRRNLMASARRKRPAQTRWDNGLEESLNQFSETTRDRLSAMHSETVSAVAGIRGPTSNLRLRTEAMKETVDVLMAGFREAIDAINEVYVSEALSENIATLTTVAELIQQLMKEILTFNTAEYDALRDLARSLMASVRHDLNQTPPGSFNSIRFMLEPHAYVRSAFQSQSVRTALRGHAGAQDDATPADRVV